MLAVARGYRGGLQGRLASEVQGQRLGGRLQSGVPASGWPGE